MFFSHCPEDSTSAQTVGELILRPARRRPKISNLILPYHALVAMSPPPQHATSSTKVEAESSLRSTRVTRQRTCKIKSGSRSTEIEIIDVDAVVPLTTSSPTPRPAFSGNVLPDFLTKSITGLDKHDLSILRKKQKWLREFKISKPPVRDGMDLSAVVDATLVFAQEDAGTAVCIAPEGILLTCSHCIAESAEELSDQRQKWLIFASGQVVQTECIAWDMRRDLALLRIVSCQQPTIVTPPSSLSLSPVHTQSFPFVVPADLSPPLGAAFICVGHPGSEDLEASKPGITTNYDVLHVSLGRFRGYAPGQDVQDNTEIGALMHDCWTYWGHSGAPLVEQRSGRLVGLHSSWDDQTGMRRGVGSPAIKTFLDEHVGLWKH
ncbi:hypothetical protein BYT27DRAFT_7191842 [Phlegmacium glaucopus]|nr:hypothetical protein BYT27DRAFT_7191842 [Phlegmacium glaucopus]